MEPEREQRLADLVLEALERPAEEQERFLEAACGDDPSLLAEALACLGHEEDLGSFLERPALDPRSPQAMASYDDDHLEATVPDGPRLRTTTSPPSAPGPAIPGAEDGGGNRAEGHGEAAETGETLGEATVTLSGDESWFEKLGRQQLGAYEIVGLLGEGGMGQVYVGEDARLGRQVAVKILPPDMAERPGWLERFEREARALATLNHPNIITIHSIEVDEGIRFLTMELVAGRTLKERLAGGALPVEEILRIALALGGALAAAHQRGVIHRDLKPANVMLTDEGRVKILDFGIAKLESLGPSQISRDGQVIGTVAYMAPEQLEGVTVDARADLFSLGVLLYQMATGSHPFPARHSMERINAILRHDPKDPSILRPDLPPELVRIILRCLEKDPDRRYPDAATLRGELEALEEERTAKRILESRTDWKLETAHLAEPAKKGYRRILVLFVVLLLAAISAAWILRRDARPAGSSRAPVSSSAADSPDAMTAGEHAVMPLVLSPFQNLTGDPEVDWLSEGIVDLLAIDLGQAPRLTIAKHPELAGGDAELPREDRPYFMLGGSYARVGEILRIAFTLEDPVSDRIVDAAAFEGRGVESLFELVDELATTVLAKVGASRPELGPTTVEEATTSSLGAFQAYSEAQRLYLRESKPEAALERLDEALRIDPDFALASVAAAKIHQSQGRNAEAERHARRAFERVDHLPLRTRFDVEAGFYGTRWATLGRAIETYELALKVYPDQPGWRNNLARRHAFFERYDDALEEFYRAIDSGVGFWGNVHGAANVHAALGDFETGNRLLEQAAAADPGNWLLGYARAWHLTEWGRFEEAESLFEILAEQRPSSPQIPYGRWRLAVLRQDWPEADSQAHRLLALDDSFALWRGHVSLARNALYQGRARSAIGSFERAVAVSQGADRALARCWLAELLLALDRPAEALEHARQAQRDGFEQWPELEGMFLAALSHGVLGRTAEAETLLEGLREHWRRQPNAVEERQVLRLTGLLELARGDGKAAAESLGRAAALLPPRGVEFSWHVFPDHVPLLVDLAAAELEAGRPAAALERIDRIRGLGSERLEHPLPWVESFYLEARALEASGREEEARRRFADFLHHWSGGELGRAWLLEARRKVETADPADEDLSTGRG